MAMLESIADTSALRSAPAVERLLAEQWPGSLTVLFPKRDVLANNVTAGQDKVCVDPFSVHAFK